MDQVEIPFSIRCPRHRAQPIGLLNLDPNAKDLGYCYECIVENQEDSSLFETLKTVSTYLKDTSDFYEKWRQRVQTVNDPPAEFLEELSKKGERLEKFSQHIGQEKEKVKKNFEEIRKTALQIINEKEKECLELLDRESTGLSEAYTLYEKLLIMGWPKPSDIRNIYPETDMLVQKMSKIESLDQLRAFMAGINEDVRIQDKYFVEDNGSFTIKKTIDGLIRGSSLQKDCLPKVQSQILNSEDLENLMKDLMKGFIRQEVEVKNSTVSAIKTSIYESQIIFDNQFETLRNWLPRGYKFDLKLLFRGSTDEMSTVKFHEKCDEKGATITLIKCRLDGGLGLKTIGGFVDQSWHSNNCSSTSKEAFLFSLAEQSQHSVKCPILENHFGDAIYGGPQSGPIFGPVNGYGPDLYLDFDWKTVRIIVNSYSNTGALMNGNGGVFNVEEVEVFQVL